MISPIKPTGIYTPVKKSGWISDASRNEMHLQEVNVARALSYDIWLPSSIELSDAPYHQEAINFWETANFWSEAQQKVLKHELDSFRCYTHPFATHKVIQKDLPLIVFLHGFGAWGSFYTYIIEDLVSQGFAILSINHTYQAGLSLINGHLVLGNMTHEDLFTTDYAEAEQGICIEDVCFMLDRLDLIFGEALVEQIDKNRLSVMGQSFGGSTALHIADKRSDIRCCINLDGAVFGNRIPDKVTCPALIIFGELSHCAARASDALEVTSTNLNISEEMARLFIDAYVNRTDHMLKQANISQHIISKADHLAFTDFLWLKDSELFAMAPVGTESPNKLVSDIRKVIHDFIKAS